MWLQTVSYFDIACCACLAKAVVLPVAIPLALGSLTGAFLGAKVGVHIPEEHLKVFFGVVMLGLGGRTVLKAFSK